MSTKIEPMNLVQCSGRVVMKRFDEENQRLVFMIGVFKLKIVNKGAPNDYVRDFPVFTMTGERAKETAALFETGDNISILGHVDTMPYMLHTAGNNFQQRWRLVLIADAVNKNGYNGGSCSVTVAGEILRVYRNADQGHRFYMITIRTGEGRDAPKANVFHFDHDMVLEPQVGDFISSNGILQTKREETSNGRSRMLMTVVSRFVFLDRKN